MTTKTERHPYILIQPITGQAAYLGAYAKESEAQLAARNLDPNGQLHPLPVARGLLHQLAGAVETAEGDAAVTTQDAGKPKPEDPADILHCPNCGAQNWSFEDCIRQDSEWNEEYPNPTIVSHESTDQRIECRVCAEEPTGTWLDETLRDVFSQRIDGTRED